MQEVRRHGRRRYDYMDVVGRIESGTEIENRVRNEGREQRLEQLSRRSERGGM
jgi:hypothetical protein